MIRYALRCEVDHEFEAWFASSDGYDEQVRQGLVQCPMCGTQNVTKAIMAPQVRTSKGADAGLAEAQKAVAEAMHRLRQHVESTHDYVGSSFASEARDIHEGLAPDRPIYGEATPQEVKSLVEEGVHVAPLPVFSPKTDDGAPKPVPAGQETTTPANRKLN
ncbi:hypothetical protein ABAC460_01560 [Asticcacaulis sp. AC460]|uniref:DUF1178 family protein n=1 Tax=Asticcacaulis sp. AC460 TaxID=1282360 RepID=UPI0003C3FD59|nr:DUF1178 family protein [Asticcacaulis sp. AC460]ESQ92963.1 hypothetical protein ABAC460_01560 [Asticcacaulis sp. AC460]